MREGFPLPDVQWEPTREYWAGAARGELRLPRCLQCRSFHWYPDGDTCRACGAQAIEWETVGGRGRLFTWVLLEHAFLPQYASGLPFVSALVTLDEDPSVRLPTRIVDAAPESLRIDQPVEVCFRPLRFEGVEGEVVAPLFRPVSTAGASSTE